MEVESSWAHAAARGWLGLGGRSGEALLSAATRALESNVCGLAAPGLALHERVLHPRGHKDGCTFEEEAPADGGSSSGSKEAAAMDVEEEEEKEDKDEVSDSEPAGEFAEPEKESDFGNDGLRMPKERRVIKPTVEYGTRPTERARHARLDF